jgi:hypothetical protein
VTEHDDCKPCQKALNEPATHILHDIPTGATDIEVGAVLEKCYGDNHLKAAIHAQLKRRTQHIKQSLQESAAVIEHLAPRAFGPPEHLICKEAAHVYGSKK